MGETNLKERHAKKSKRRNELTRRRRKKRERDEPLNDSQRCSFHPASLIAGIMLTPIKVRNVFPLSTYTT